MICPECNGMGETVYYVETTRDENTVTMEQRKGICRTCNGSGEKPMTNADRIRAVSDEKLALFVRDIISAESCPGIYCDCDECFFKEPCSNSLKWYGKEIKWLQQPFEGE